MIMRYPILHVLYNHTAVCRVVY